MVNVRCKQCGRAIIGDKYICSWCTPAVPVIVTGMTDEQRKEISEVRHYIRTAENAETKIHWLREFQRLLIETDFCLGLSHMYRLVKELEKLGKFDEAEKERKVVDKAYYYHKVNYRNYQVAQIEIGESEYIRFKCDNPEAPVVCQASDNVFEPIQNSKLYARFKNCPDIEKCFCQVYGYTKKRYERELARNSEG